MKKSRFAEGQILAILKQHEVGVPVAELSREHNISTALIYISQANQHRMPASSVSTGLHGMSGLTRMSSAALPTLSC